MPSRIGELDVPTLLFVTALVVAFSGIYLMLARGRGRDTQAMGVWGAAMVVGAIGLIVIARNQDGSSGLLAVGQAIFLAACATSWTAARLFADRAPRLGLAVAGPAALLCAYWVGTPDRLMLAAACLLGAGYTAASAMALRLDRAEPLPSRAPTLVLLALHAVVYAARGLVALFVGDLGQSSAPVLVVILLESLLHTVGMAFLLLAMVKERVDRRSSEQLRALASVDGLTGLANRRTFDERLDVETSRARRTGRPLALLLIDVDHFKLFNDSFGHPAGDACLRAVAKGIAAGMKRGSDLAARYGGEEFAVLLPDTSVAGAVEAADAIRAEIERAAIPHATPCRCVTVSIGAASLVLGPNMPVAALITLADRALYDAKAAGRNAVRTAGLLALVPSEAA